MQHLELNNDNYSSNEKNNNVLESILGKYLPWWPLFGVLFGLGIIGALIFLRYATPIYESSASILLKDDNKGLSEGNIMESLNLFGSKKIVENEIEVFRSRTLAKEVVKNLQLYAPVYKKGRIRNISAYNLSPLAVEALYPDSIKSTLDEKIYFSQDSSGMVKVLDSTYKVGQWINTEYGTIRFIPNRNYITPEEDDDSRQNLRLYFTLSTVKSVATKFLKELEVSASSKQSTVINILYKDAVPKRAENILNELIGAYNRAAVNDKNLLAANTLSFVEDRLRYVVGELDSVEQSLERYKTQNKIIDISEQGKQFLESVTINDQKVVEMNMQLAVLSQVENYVLSKDKSSAIVPSTLGVTDPVLAKLLDQLYMSEAEYEKMRKTTAENNPLLIAVKDQINAVRPSILENIRNQRRSLEAGRNNILGTSNNYASMLQRLPGKERKLLDISRQQTIKNSIYTFLLQKREETMLSYASTVADSRVVDIAESTEKPVSPRKLIVFAVSIALFLIFGIIFIEAKEVMNRNIMFRAEIEKNTKAPILAEIGQDVSGAELVIAEGKRSFIAEQFRQLRTSLGYLGINARKKKLLVTSSISGEGKSFVCANLGVSIALTGKKVVMLELDLRKPKLVQAFNVSRNVGLTNYFIGEKEPEDIIKSTDVINLFVIPSGPVPPNPSELILNGRLVELLKYLEMHFDFIIIDTAPVNPVTDAYIVSPMCDATLYVMRHGYTPRIHLHKLNEQNRIRELKNMAIVFNGVKNRGYGSYGYGYGYGYTEDEPKKKSWKKYIPS